MEPLRQTNREAGRNDIICDCACSKQNIPSPDRGETLSDQTLNISFRHDPSREVERPCTIRIARNLVPELVEPKLRDSLTSPWDALIQFARRGAALLTVASSIISFAGVVATGNGALSANPILLTIGAATALTLGATAYGLYRLCQFLKGEGRIGRSIHFPQVADL